MEIRLDEVDAVAVGDRGASADELSALNELGYVVVPSLLPASQVAQLRLEFERLVATDPRSRVHELGTRRAAAGNGNEVLAVCWRHRVVLDAAALILGERFEVGHVDLRDPSPSYGQQGYHPDYGSTPLPGLTATWFLDAFTSDNGATRLLAGSHRSDSPPAGAGSSEPVAGEVVAVGPAGSVLLRDARLYHRAGRNSTVSRRRSALVFYQHHLGEPTGPRPLDG